jgi:hypothetical protein
MRKRKSSPQAAVTSTGVAATILNKNQSALFSGHNNSERY